MAEQLAAAKRNFEVGTSPSPIPRSPGWYDLVVAQELAANNDLQVKSLALSQLVGRANAQPKPVKQPLDLPSVTPADMNQWVETSQHTKSAVQQATLEVGSGAT